MYSHIIPTWPLLVELNLPQETEFIRFFICPRQQPQEIETEETSTVGWDKYKPKWMNWNGPIKYHAIDFTMDPDDPENCQV
jgi:hypothetical protein